MDRAQKNRLQYLMSLTAGKITEEIIVEREALKEEQLKEAKEFITAQYSLDVLSEGLPNDLTTLQLLRQTATTIIPDVPHVAFAKHSELTSVMSGQATAANTLANIYFTRLCKVRGIRKRAEAMWAEQSPTSNKWELSLEFESAASDLVQLEMELEMQHTRCIEISKDRQRALKDLETISYSLRKE